MNDLNARHLRAFRILADELHFGRAAAHLGMGQPYLSRIIKNLEEDLDLELFVRRPKVKLTPAGSTLLDSTRRALDELELGVRRARGVSNGAENVVLGVASTAVLGPVRDGLRRFASAGDHRLTIREMHSNEQVEALGARTIDLGILREIPADRTLAWTCILQEELVAVLPVGHELGPDRIDVSDLADEAFVLFRPSVSPRMHRGILDVCRVAGFTPRIEHEVEEWHTILGLVSLNLGVSIAPSGLSRLRLDGVRYAGLSTAEHRVGLYLCWPRDGLSQEGEKLRDMLIERAS
jgi:DNA-binding transcriptional LysR family regulator